MDYLRIEFKGKYHPTEDLSEPLNALLSLLFSDQGADPAWLTYAILDIFSVTPSVEMRTVLHIGNSAEYQISLRPMLNIVNDPHVLLTCTTSDLENRDVKMYLRDGAPYMGFTPAIWLHHTDKWHAAYVIYA